MEGIGRVESGTETESNAGAVAEDAEALLGTRLAPAPATLVHPCTSSLVS